MSAEEARTEVDQVTDSRPQGSLEELTIDECCDVLGRRSVGLLAVSINNRPDIFPVNFLIHDGTIVIRTSWLVSGTHPNFIATMLKLGARGEPSDRDRKL